MAALVAGDGVGTTIPSAGDDDGVGCSDIPFGAVGMTEGGAWLDGSAVVLATKII